jgi:hypothetical protein
MAKTAETDGEGSAELELPSLLRVDQNPSYALSNKDRHDMQSLTLTATTWTALTITAAAVSTAVPLSSQMFLGSGGAATALVPAVRTVTAAEAVEAVRPLGPGYRIKAAPPPEPAATMLAAAPSDKSLRSQIRFETVRWGGKPVQTLDEPSRILLAQAAAQRAGLHEVGLSFHDVYGVIEAETSWIPRTGFSKNGTPNLGLAQFEPRTARGLGIKDPHDPVQAVFGAALYMKEGAEWAHGRIADLELPPAQKAAKVREGVSVYYNLSVKGRNKWNGLNTAQLPPETQKHIRNTRAGAAESLQLARRLLDA